MDSSIEDALTLIAHQRQRVHRANFERFAHQVRSAVGGSILRYSDRRVLLRAAADRRISRFDANLIIAAVQHRLEHDPSHRPLKVSSKTLQTPVECRRAEASRAAALAVQVMAAQFAILTAAWWLTKDLW